MTKTDWECFEQIANYWNLTTEELKKKIECHRGDIEDRIIEFLEACERDPEQTKCERCGKLNINFDDCGFWACYTEDKRYLAYCSNHPEIPPHRGER